VQSYLDRHPNITTPTSQQAMFDPHPPGRFTQI